MASEKEISIIVRVKDEASKAIERLNGTMGSFYSKGIEPATGASKALAAGLLGVGAAAAGFGAMAVNAAMGAQVQMAQFDATLKTMGGTALGNRDAILAAAAATTKLGFDDEDAAVSIGNLYQRTGDLNKAMEYNALAMDLSRAKGMELSEASKMVGMVLSGNGKLLKQYGIELDENLKPADALAELQKKLAGQAGAYASTMKGQIDVFHNSWGNFLETVGDKLLPTLTKILEKVNDFVQNTLPKWIDTTKTVVEWLDKHRVVIAIVAGAILGGLVPALYAWATAMIPVIAAFVASAIALAPFLIGGAIIGGLIYGIVQLVKHWDEVKAKVAEVWGNMPSGIKTAIEIILAVLFPFIAIIILIVKHWDELKAATIAAWDAIKGAISDAWEWIKNAVTVAVTFIAALVIGIFDLMGIDLIAIWQSIQNFFTQSWDTIKALFATAGAALTAAWTATWNAIKTAAIVAWDAIKALIKLAWDFLAGAVGVMAAPFVNAIAGIWDKVKGAATSAWDSIKGVVTGAINAMIDKINSFISSVNKVASSGAGKLGVNIPNIPSIPRLAAGGIVTKPTLALIGEAGAEAVVPLTRGRGAMGGFGGVNVVLQGTFLTDAEQIEYYGNMIANAIKQQIRI